MLKEIFRRHINIYESINNLNLDQDKLNEILKGYLEAALWTEEERLTDEYHESNPSYDNNYDDDDDDDIEKLIRIKQNLNSVPFERFIVDDLDNNSKIQAYIDIKTFIMNSGSDAILEAISENGLFKLGMDIWLTRNGHGAGFFDYEYENEKELIEAGKKLGEVDLYINDYNTISFSNA